MVEAWQRQLKESLTDAAQLAERFAVEVDVLQAVIERYPMRITPYYFNLIEQADDPIWRQCVPDPAELAEGGLVDPLAEESLSPVPAVIHRYPDRVVLLASNNCASYCRFCTRKRKVGCATHGVSFREQRDGIAYIAETPQIRDVILSGGDPLLLPDVVLRDLLERIHAIPHVETIRIGTRMPTTLPQRITVELCAVLKRFHPLFINTHFNHPRELTVEAVEACGRLADAGISLGNQTVLLKGVNDHPETIAQLFRGLLKMRVRPYYLHQMDLTSGTAHFRTPLQTGLDIMRALRGPVSGMASPHYVVDLPGGKGKVPLQPEYLDRSGTMPGIWTPDGERVSYPDI
ncbi:MAG: lysine 2,3-aminomutase [Desulfuromonas sp.]|nr:MAG: lysine 2,3-aminomutase [Desulfuromonas sp.]